MALSISSWARDLGQTGNPSHPDGYEALVLGFHAAGIGPDELDMMMVRNPARLLGLSVEN